MSLLEALGREIPDERLVTDVDVVASLSGDDAEWAPVGAAAVALRARTEAEVAHAVRVCADLGVPLVPAAPGPGCPEGRTPSTAASCWTCRG
jgi:glycolate oxidase